MNNGAKIQKKKLPEKFQTKCENSKKIKFLEKNSIFENGREFKKKIWRKKTRKITKNGAKI